MGSINEYALATRPIYCVMGRQDCRATALCAVDATLVDKGPVDALAPAHVDPVLFARAGHGSVVATANAGRPEQVVVWGSVVDERTLLGVGAGRIERDVVAAAGCVRGLGGHGDLIEVVPERAEVEDEFSVGCLD